MELFNLRCVTFLMTLWLFIEQSSTEIGVSPVAMIDACLVEPYKGEAPVVYIESKCVCRATEHHPGNIAEWIDHRSGEFLATGKHFATLDVIPDYLAKETSIVCRMRNMAGSMETPLPTVIDTPKEASLILSDDVTDNTFYTSTHCPKSISFVCTTKKIDIHFKALARANITFYDRNGGFSQRTLNLPDVTMTEDTFLFPFQVNLNQTGHMFIRCTTTTSFHWTTTTTAQRNFHVKERPMDPMIKTHVETRSGMELSSEINAEPGTSFQIMCSFPYTRSGMPYTVHFECDNYTVQPKAVSSTSLWIEIPDDGSQRIINCMCSIELDDCGHQWQSERRFVVNKNTTTADGSWDATTADTLLVTKRTGTMRESYITQKINTVQPEVSENLATSVTNDGTSTDTIDGDEGDDGGGDGTLLALVVAGMTLVNILVAGVFFCIGLRVGYRKKEYNLEGQPIDNPKPSSKYKNTRKTTAKTPVEEAYTDNVEMVGLEPSHIYSLAQPPDNRDPNDLPMKIQPQQQHQQQQPNNETSDDATYDIPATSRQKSPIPVKEHDQNDQTQAVKKKKLYDNNMLSKLHIKLPKKDAKDKKHKPQKMSVEDGIYDYPSNKEAFNDTKTKKKAKDKKCKTQKMSVEDGIYDCPSNKEAFNDTKTKKKAKDKKCNTQKMSVEDGIYDCPSNKEAFNDTKTKKNKKDKKLKPQKMSVEDGIYDCPSNREAFDDTNAQDKLTQKEFRLKTQNNVQNISETAPDSRVSNDYHKAEEIGALDYRHCNDDDNVYEGPSENEYSNVNFNVTDQKNNKCQYRTQNSIDEKSQSPEIEEENVYERPTSCDLFNARQNASTQPTKQLSTLVQLDNIEEQQLQSPEIEDNVYERPTSCDFFNARRNVAQMAQQYEPRFDDEEHVYVRPLSQEAEPLCSIKQNKNQGKQTERSSIGEPVYENRLQNIYEAPSESGILFDARHEMTDQQFKHQHQSKNKSLHHEPSIDENIYE